MKYFVTPPKNNGISKVSHELFCKHLKVPAVRISSQNVTKFQKILQKHILDLPRTRKVVDVEPPTPSSTLNRLILLNPIIAGKDDLPSEIVDILDSNGFEFTTYNLILDYNYWTSDQILRSIIPDELDVPSAFETIGHIAHLNLREHYGPYKNIIGNVILEVPDDSYLCLLES
ncbi:tRNA(m(1)G37)methyltransferase [Nowakowskiella sp. JEL0078]|nr:tRNA(m(1)G37)methyltransferase [Nowakowskiella sp. JEL0078]